MNQTTFSAVKNRAGSRAWQSLFQAYWPAYRQWYMSKKPGGVNARELATACRALKSTMPEIMPVYDELCELVNDDPEAMQFLTMYQPPAYLINCSQAVFFDEQPMLIRNYDLSPELSENTIIHTGWQSRKVIATNECLWGADDGMNDAGLAVSLTFGGRRVVGSGFGIPIIMRYVLQTCENVKEAIEQLKRVPSHMAYNVTAVDQSGDFATVLLAPDQAAIVTRQGVATNHQQHITWPEQAGFTRTLERKRHLEALLEKSGLNENTLVDAFHRSPLYSSNYRQNFGTVYTAVYKPLSGSMAYHWPDERWQHSFKAFDEGTKSIMLGKPARDTLSPAATALPQASICVPSFDAGRVSELITPAVLRQFGYIFSYLPQDCVANKSAYRQLKNELESDESMSWTRFSGAMQQLWA